MSRFDKNLLGKIESIEGVIEYVVSAISPEFNVRQPLSEGSTPGRGSLAVGTESKYNRMVESMKYLILVHKGLSKDELVRLVNLEEERVEMIVRLLDAVILKNGDHYKIYLSNVVEYVKTKYFDANSEMTLFKHIAEVLDATPNSVRKLEELIYSLTESKSWFQLKQIVSAVENFLILFNPEHKFGLGICWSNLISQHYDPVVEYSKSLELYEMHYQPTIEELYQIVLQISRFMKELMDLTQDELPEFRHPFIRNRILTKTEKQDQQERDLNTTLKKGSLGESVEFEDDNRIGYEEYSIDEKEEENNKNTNHLEDIGLLKDIKLYNMYEDASNTHQVLRDYEKFNVDIPAGEEKYMLQFRKMVATENKMKTPFAKESELDDQEDEGKVNLNVQVSDRKSLTGSGFGSEDKESMEEGKNKKQEEKKGQYFYKRWIWIMFPWACMSVAQDGNYSELIKKCFKSDLKYIRVGEELELTSKALQIAISAKLKKKAVLETLSGDYLIDEDLKKLENQIVEIKKSQKMSSLFVAEDTSIRPTQTTANPITGRKYTIGTALARGFRKPTVDMSLKSLKSVPDAQPADTVFMTSLQEPKKALSISKNSMDQSRLSSKVLFPGDIRKSVVNNKEIEEMIKRRIEGVRDIYGIQRMVRDVRQIMNKRKEKEIEVLEDRNKEMVTKWNKLVEENRKKREVLESCRRELIRDGSSLIKDSNTEGKLRGLEQKCRVVKEKYDYEMLQHNRLKKIIEICILNKDTNEEWIRQLNYLITNMMKLSKKNEERKMKEEKESHELNAIVKNSIEINHVKDGYIQQLIVLVNGNIKNQMVYDDIYSNGYQKQDNTTSTRDLEKYIMEEKRRQTEIIKLAPRNRKSIKDTQEQDKNVSMMLAKYRSDMLKLGKFLNMSMKDLLRTRGNIRSLKRYEKHNKDTMDMEYSSMLFNRRDELVKERETMDKKVSFYRHMKEEEGIETKRTKIRNITSQLATLESQKNMLNTKSRRLLTSLQALSFASSNVQVIANKLSQTFNDKHPSTDSIEADLSSIAVNIQKLLDKLNKQDLNHHHVTIEDSSQRPPLVYNLPAPTHSSHRGTSFLLDKYRPSIFNRSLSLAPADDTHQTVSKSSVS